MDDETSDVVINRFLHDINCLSDNDRAIRKAGLDKLSQQIFLVKNKDHIKVLLFQYLMSPLLKCLEDPIERNRITTVNFFYKFLNEIPFDKMNISILTSAILSRIDHSPLPESSEELRQQLIGLLSIIIYKYTDESKSHIAELAKMLSFLLRDDCPEIKVKLSEFIIQFANKLRHEIGAHCKGIVDSLCLNIQHQQNKIRKITTNALVEVLLCDNAGNLLGDCIPFLKPITNDKNLDVRRNFYTSIAHLLNKLNIVYLRKSEPYLVMLLLNGLSDQKEEIKIEAAKLIEEAGNIRRKLALEIGEEISQ